MPLTDTLFIILVAQNSIPLTGSLFIIHGAQNSVPQNEPLFNIWGAKNFVSLTDSTSLIIRSAQNSVPLTMEVTEEIPVGIRIGEVAAVDQDEGVNAEIDYAITREYRKTKRKIYIFMVECIRNSLRTCVL